MAYKYGIRRSEHVLTRFERFVVLVSVCGLGCTTGDFRAYCGESTQFGYGHYWAYGKAHSCLRSFLT